MVGENGVSSKLMLDSWRYNQFAVGGFTDLTVREKGMEFNGLMITRAKSFLLCAGFKSTFLAVA